MDDFNKKKYSLEYKGTFGDLFLYQIKSIIFSFLTLGFYRFWSRTAVRHYIASNMKLGSDYFHYHGTAVELLISFLKAIPIIIGIIIAFIGLSFIHPSLSLVVYVGFFYLGFLAFLSAIRYRLTRLSFRMIRFSFKGSVWECASFLFCNFFLNMVTLGFLAHRLDFKASKNIQERMCLGSLAFSVEDFDDKTMDALKWSNIATLLAIPFTFGLSRFAYRARFLTYFFKQIRLGDVRLSCNIKTWDLLRLHVGNIFILICSLGFLSSLVLHRTIRFWVDRVCVYGDINDSIIQSEAFINSGGEGLGQALGIGDGFDII